MTMEKPREPQDAPGPGLDPASVCTLPAVGLSERLAWIRREVLPHVLTREPLEGGLAFELRAAPELAARLDRWIELERECCSGLEFERVAGRRRGHVRLEIRGIDPDAALFADLPGSAASPSPRVGRLARAAAAGLAASVVVCCLLPIAAAALLGAAAAPLAALDGPLPMAGGAVLAGSAAWLWLARRRHGTAPVCGPEC